MNEADADELALLKDPGLITAEWLESEGWKHDTRYMRIKFFHPDSYSSSFDLYVYPDDHKVAFIGDTHSEIPCKTRGQLRCLIIGLGGEA